MHKERLTLATLCGGAIQEKVDRALKAVAENLLDPNVVYAKKRSINLKITFKPSDTDPEDVEVETIVTMALAPEVGVTTNLFVSKDLESGKVTVMEHRRGEIKGQLDFSDVGLLDEEHAEEEHQAENEVIDFRTRREG